MFELRGVRKAYGATTALALTDLFTERGKTTVLIGPSGCGKSTMLRLMIGLALPDAGTVTFDGRRLQADNVLELRRRMGYVIQDGGLFPHLTARGNVTLLARHVRVAPSEIASRVAQLAELCRLPEVTLDRFPAELSGGQRQRVSLMRSLMLDPGALLLDEPLGALDPMIRADLSTDLRAIFQDLGKTVVMVTHDMREAAYFADRIVLMRDGAIIQQGSERDLRTRPVDPFVTRFLDAQALAEDAR
ncbi:MAG: ATP-binding cassette domain-containing protein [Acidobacteriota bacterium]